MPTWGLSPGAVPPQATHPGNQQLNGGVLAPAEPCSSAARSKWFPPPAGTVPAGGQALPKTVHSKRHIDCAPTSLDPSATACIARILSDLILEPGMRYPQDRAQRTLKMLLRTLAAAVARCGGCAGLRSFLFVHGPVPGKAPGKGW